MLINHYTDDNHHVEFVSYSGKYPNLCNGLLILKIDEKQYSFGNKITYEGKVDFPKFWCSGGECGFTDSNYSDTYREQNEWEINVNNIPEQFQKYAGEIDKVFNENVEWGCCGGCL